MDLSPWGSPGKNIELGCHFLLQQIAPTQGSNPHLLCLLHCRQILYLLSHQEMPFPGVTLIMALGYNLPEHPCVLGKKPTRPGIWAQCDTIGFHRGGRRAEGCRDQGGLQEAEAGGMGSRKRRIQLTPMQGFLEHWPTCICTEATSSTHHL